VVVEGEVDLLEGDAFEVERPREGEGPQRLGGLSAAPALDHDALDVVGAEGAKALGVLDGADDLLAAEAVDEVEDLLQVAVEGDLGLDQAL